MNPLALHARNYRCFERLDLDFPDGCVAILGANGAGKSSIVNAIDVTIFGPQGRSLADLLSDTAVDDELLLELVLEHAGRLFRIRRTFSPKGRGKTTLDLEECNLDPPWGPIVATDWEPLTRASAKETQELLETTLGLTRETFRASAFLAQGDGAAFCDAQPRDRKRILADVLGLNRYDRLQELARVDRRRLEAEIQMLDGRVAAARETAAGRRDAELDLRECVDGIVEARDQVADLEREHAQLAERYQAAREQAARRQTVEARLAAARAELEQLQRADVAATDAGTAILAAREEMIGLPQATETGRLEQRIRDLFAAIEAHRAASEAHELAKAALIHADRERADLGNRADALRQEAERLRMQASTLDARPLDDGARCDHCGQILGVEAREQRLTRYQADAAARDTDAARLLEQAAAIAVPVVPAAPEGDAPTGELETVRRQLAAVQQAAADRARLEERIVQLQPIVDARPSEGRLVVARDACLVIGAELDALAPADDVDEITRQGSLVKQRLETACATVTQQDALKARLDARLEQIAAAEAQIAEHADTRAGLQTRLDVAAALEKAFGRDGIPALILENSAIPSIETEANRILDELGTSYRVELRTQAELKSGDGLRDTLDVVVQTEHGERPYETFSGGEKTRLNLALRIGLARLLAHRRGAESRLLVIDEPDGLDEAGMGALVDVLNRLRGDFEKLYVVSHVPALRDSFDTTMTVRDGTVDAGVFEAAIA